MSNQPEDQNTVTFPKKPVRELSEFPVDSFEYFMSNFKREYDYPELFPNLNRTIANHE